MATKHVQSLAAQRTWPTLEQWRELPRFLNRQERLRALLSGALFCASLLTLGVYYWSTSIIRVPTLGGTYSEGFIGSPRYINPLYSEGSDADRDLTRLVFRGLTKAAPEGYVADLAQEIVVESPTVTKVTLRSDVRFHNGETLTSSDVLFTLDALKNPAYGSPLLSAYQDISAEAESDTVVRFTTKEGLDLLPLLSIGILPSNVWQSVPPDRAILSSLNLRPVGNGPYQVSKLTRNEDGDILSVTLTAFPDFPGDGPYIETIVAKFSPTTNALGEALLAGQMDAAATVPIFKAEKLRNDGRFSILTPALPQYVAAYFNTKNALFSSEVRNALALAVDRAQVAAQARGSFARAWPSPILPGMPGSDSISLPTADIGAAQAALDAAGWTVGEGGVRMKGETRLAFTITAVENEEFTAAAEALAEVWRSLGADVQTQTISRVSFLQSVLKERTFDVLVADAQYMGNRPDPYLLWHSSQAVFPGLNVSQFSSNDVDGAVNAIRKNESPEKVGEAYATLASAFAAAMPAVVLYQPTYIYAANADIRGIDLPSLRAPADRFDGITAWYLKTRTVRRQH